MNLLADIREIAIFLLVALLFAFGLYTTLGVALQTDIPVVAVTSGSMEPAFQRGDMIVVYGKPFDEIEVGDVVVYQIPYKPIPIIHRVINRTNTTLETMGDNNPGQVTYCVAPAKNGCQERRERLVMTEDGPKCISPGRDCDEDETLVNVEKNITRDQVLGTAAFTVPYLAQLKLIPTCIFLQIMQPGADLSQVCG